MSIYLLAFLMGMVAGLRSMTAPTAVSWATRLGWLHLQDTWLAFLAYVDNAIHLECARLRRVDRRQVAKHAEPESTEVCMAPICTVGVVRQPMFLKAAKA